jgi:hypothetical protein
MTEDFDNSVKPTLATDKRTLKFDNQGGVLYLLMIVIRYKNLSDFKVLFTTPLWISMP